MSSSPPLLVRAGALRDVVALVPFECGFHPRRSLVVLSLRGPRMRIGQVTRLDLPCPAGPHDLPHLLDDVVSCVVRDGGRASVVAVYDDADWDPERPPHLDLVMGLLGELDRRGAPARDAVYVTPERYWSYQCRGSGCCPPEGGLVADAMSSPVAAAFVLAGLAPLPSREELVARVHPNRPALVAQVADNAWQWLGAFAEEADAAERDAAEGVPGAVLETVRQRVAAAADVLDRLVAEYRAGRTSMTVDHAGHLVAALQSVPVRDELLLRYCRAGLPMPPAVVAGSGDAAELPGLERPDGPDPEAEEAMQRLLMDLCARVEGPLAAAPLSLLGWHSWARGEGALARIAVDRATAEDPTYRLAGLLTAVLDHGIPPDWVGDARRADEEAG